MRIKYFIWGLVLITTTVLITSYAPTKPCVPHEREIAITVDDLPGENDYLEKITHALEKHKAPAIGFVIANQVNKQHVKQLHDFLDSGFLIGNHSYSHLNLRTTSAATYIDDVKRADKILSPLMSGTKYYRYPYLAQGSLLKKQKVLNYLAENNYTVAPITIDSRDFEFNLKLAHHISTNGRIDAKWFDTLGKHYLNYVWKQTVAVERRQRCNATKQILLLHANYLNAYFLDDLLQMYQNHGYRFITLADALVTSQKR